MVNRFIAYFRALDNKRSKKRLESLRVEAESKAKLKFNIIRHEGVDYITFMGNIVSTKKDYETKDSVSLCERLDLYRKSYVANCIEKGVCE